jgi:hypothetical protein
MYPWTSRCGPSRRGMRTGNSNSFREIESGVARERVELALSPQ